MSNEEEKYRKQLMFDLDTKVCAQILGKSYRKVYDDIERFLLQNDFSHPQGSGYVSNKELTNIDVFKLTRGILAKHPYLTKCIRDIRVADIVSLNSINYCFDYDGTPGEFKRKEQEEQAKQTRRLCR